MILWTRRIKRLTDDVGQLLIGVRSAVRAGVTGRWIITSVAETVIAFLLGVALIVTAAATGAGSYAGFEFLNLETHLKTSEVVVVGRFHREAKATDVPSQRKILARCKPHGKTPGTKRLPDNHRCSLLALDDRGANQEKQNRWSPYASK